MPRPDPPDPETSVLIRDAQRRRLRKVTQSRRHWSGRCGHKPGAPERQELGEARRTLPWSVRGSTHPPLLVPSLGSSLIANVHHARPCVGICCGSPRGRDRDPGQGCCREPQQAEHLRKERIRRDPGVGEQDGSGPRSGQRREVGLPLWSRGLLSQQATGPGGPHPGGAEGKKVAESGQPPEASLPYGEGVLLPLPPACSPPRMSACREPPASLPTREEIDALDQACHTRTVPPRPL